MAMDRENERERQLTKLKRFVFEKATRDATHSRFITERISWVTAPVNFGFIHHLTGQLLFFFVAAAHTYKQVTQNNPDVPALVEAQVGGEIQSDPKELVEQGHSDDP